MTEKLQVIDLTHETFDFSAGKFSISGFTGQDGKQWFSAKIACDNLGLANVSRAVSRLPYRDKANITISNNGRPVRHLMVTEPGLYRLIFSSRTEDAEQYQDWVFNDVLPSIRAHGGYISPDANAAQLADLQADVEQKATQIRSLERKTGYLEKHLEGYINKDRIKGIGAFIENSLPDGDKD